jgi:uncharacterized protein (TIGR02646 family)
VLAVLSDWQADLDDEWAREQTRTETERRTAGAVAEAQWNAHRTTKALEVISVALEAMASPNVARCMYCEHDRGCEIDHWRPKARDASGTFRWENLVLSCGKCNRDKLARFDERMIDPTRHDPLEHLMLLPSGRWDPSDDRGKATDAALPHLNSQKLSEARKGRRAVVMRRLTELATLVEVEPASLDDLRWEMTNETFSDVFAAVLAMSQRPELARALPPAVVASLRKHPELYEWLDADDKRRWEAAAPKLAELVGEVRRRARPEPEGP